MPRPPPVTTATFPFSFPILPPPASALIYPAVNGDGSDCDKRIQHERQNSFCDLPYQPLYWGRRSQRAATATLRLPAGHLPSMKTEATTSTVRRYLPLALALNSAIFSEALGP